MAFPAIILGAARSVAAGFARSATTGAASLRSIAARVQLDMNVTPRNLDRVLDPVQKRIRRNKRRALLRTALLGQQIIKERTADGVGYNGTFKPYSTGYAKIRQARGATLTPNLFFTGSMLGAMSAELKNSNEARIFFTRAEESKKAAFNDQIRPFFGFNQSEKNRLSVFFNREILR